MGFQPVQFERLRVAKDYVTERHLWLAPQMHGQAGSLSYEVSHKPVFAPETVRTLGKEFEKERGRHE
jgi:hypothetical protein